MQAKQHKGFTLVEVLVVLVIVGVLLGLVSVNYSRDNRQQLQQEAHRLALLLSHASNIARTTGQPVAWASQPQNYGFYGLSADGKNWTLLLNESHLYTRQLPENMRVVQTRVGGSQLQYGDKIIFSPAGLNADFLITLSAEKLSAEIQGNLLGQVIDMPVVERP